MFGSSPELVRDLRPQVEVRTGFITEEEEAAFMLELEPGLRKKRYEYDHWDDVSPVSHTDLHNVFYITCYLTTKLNCVNIFERRPY